jgi:hypothetical protein
MTGIFCVGMALPLQATAKSNLKHEPVRRQHRGIIKQVRVQLTKKAILLHWNTPSGATIVYRARKVPPALASKLARYAKAGHHTLGVGGRYAVTGKGKGTATPEFAYRVKHMWRGAQVAKWDGYMPLYTATLLPAKPGAPHLTYKVRGIIRSSMDRRDNRLVCLYGTWFTFVDGPRMLSQSSGIKGRSLFFFAAKYKRPRSWRNFRDPKKKWKAFQAAKRRKAKRLPPLQRKALVPVLTPARAKRYQQRCQHRLSPIDKKRASSQAFVRVLTHTPGATKPVTSRP